MARGSAQGEILHATGFRIRVTGSGYLRSTLRSLDDVRNVDLANLPMSSATNREPVVLSHFQEQRIQLELRTVSIDERFSISKITVFVKPVAMDYPIVQ